MDSAQMQVTTTTAAPRPVTRFEALRCRIREEFLEMPGLRLTGVQAARLLGIDRVACGILLDRLVADGFLCYGSRGHYVRADQR
jgi:hypothetical protein